MHQKPAKYMHSKLKICIKCIVVYKKNILPINYYTATGLTLYILSIERMEII